MAQKQPKWLTDISGLIDTRLELEAFIREQIKVAEEDGFDMPSWLARILVHNYEIKKR